MSPQTLPLPSEKDTFKVGFTGTRLGMTEQQRSALLVTLRRLGAGELHHGDCQGADAQAHDIGRSLQLHIVGHPPTGSGLRQFCVCDEIRDPLPYLARNRNIILQTQILIAAPDGPERSRSGTWATVRHAIRSGLPYVVINPDGVLHEETPFA